MADRPNPQVISLNAVRWNKAYRRLFAGLQTFCEDRLDEEPWAEDLFFGFQPDDEEAEAFHAAFVDWVAFDYRDWDGVTMLEHFRVENGPWDLTEERMLEAWQGARLGLYRVLEQLEHVVRLQSCLTGDEFHVQREEEIMSFDAGDLAVCRLLPVGDGFRFGFDVRTCPADAEPVIMRALERELARQRRQMPGAGWDDMFAERWPLVHDAISEAIITRS
ncbi:MAG TPA: hypothetical protein VK464_08470, partial [Symbiobacteriaceae bacterium]|nr:hypothetical protein [Symbiobacteriaceae bacterium]